jgi:hypothetical protein
MIENPLISQLISILGKEGVKALYSKICSSQDDPFESIITSVAKKLDTRYNGELLGGNLKESLIDPEVSRILKKFLLPFDEPTKDDFKPFIYFNNLPEDFFDQLKQAILCELFESKYYQDRIILILNSHKIDSIERSVVRGEGVSKEILDKVNQLFGEFESQRNATSAAIERRKISHLPTKKLYKFDHDYIPRLLFPIQEENNPFPKAQFSLLELIEKENRLLLLSSAGMGKTVEMEYLAAHFSAVNESFFPIKVSLNLYTGEEIEKTLAQEFPNWQQVPPESLVLIFDGLDEVHINHFDLAINKLIAFSHLFCNSKIIIACRDNFYNQAFARAHNGRPFFSVFKLKELDHWSIVRFINKTLDESQTDVFMNLIHEQDLYNILSSPFFLKYVLKIYIDDERLPISKVEIFEKLIEHRFVKDKERFAAKGIKIDKKQLLIETEIQRLALVIEAMGRNYITDLEFEQIIPDYDEIRQLVEHSFLFDRTKTGIWQFEHNNFQEFLAAIALAKKGFESIKKLTAIPPDYKIIKPTWVNTIAFLIILLKKESEVFNAVLSWLLEVDRELLLRFEKERVDLEIRERIFVAILEDYQSKGIVTRSEKFDIRDLAKFISDSEKVIFYLINRLEQTDKHLIIAEICSILPRLEHSKKSRGRIQMTLEDHIKNANAQEESKCYCLYALAELNWQQKNSFVAFLPSLNLESSQYERSGVYKYLTNSGFQDDYVDLLIQMVEYDEGTRVYRNTTPSRKNFDLGDESINRDECFKSVSSISGLQKTLKFLAKSHENHENDFAVSHLLEDIFTKIEKIFLDGNKELFETTIEVLPSFTKSYRKEFNSIFVGFFSNTNTLDRACHALFPTRSENNSFYQLLASIVNTEFISFLIDEFDNGRLTDDDVFSIRNCLSFTRPSATHDQFYEAITKKSNEKFVYPETPSWQELNERRYRNDLDLLANKEQFLNRIEEIFELEGKDSINKEDLWDFRKKYVEDENYFDNNLVLEVLRHDLEKPIPRERIRKDYFKGKNWEYFQISTLLRYDSQSLVSLGTREINFIRQWCNKSLQIANFPKAINNKVYQIMETQLGYFIMRFNFDYPDEVYLNLLWVDCINLPQKRDSDIKKNERTSLGDWIIQKVGLAKVSEGILNNFKVGIQSSSVLTHHIDLCKRHRIVEALPDIEINLNSDALLSHDILPILDNYLELGGNIKVVEKILLNDTRLDTNSQLRLIEKLIKHSSSFIGEYLETKLNLDGGSEQKIDYAKYLMNLGRVIGLSYYKNWIKDKGTFHDWIDQKSFIKIPYDKSLPLLIEILEIYINPNFDKEYLRAQDQDLLECLNIIGSSDEKFYKLVRAKYYELIQQFEAKILYYYLRKLDESYYTNRAKEMPLLEVINLVDSL